MKLRLAVLIVGAVVVASLVRADPPPPEIQAILAKMRSGTPPTTSELATLRAWQSNSLGKADGNAPDAGLTPPDLQAIIAKTRQGVVPTPAEVEALRAYGAQTGAHKEDLLQQDAQLKAQLEAAKPGRPTARGTPTDNLFHGRLSIHTEERIAKASRDGEGHTTTVLDVTLPVAYLMQGDQRPNGDFTLTLYADGKGAPTGSMTREIASNTHCETASGFGKASVQGWHSYYRLQPTVATANPIIATINRPAGAPRAYLMTVNPGVDGKGELIGTTHHTCSPTSSSNSTFPLDVNQVAQFTLDTMMPGVERSALGPASIAALRQYGMADPTTQSRDLREALQSAQFSFAADSFVHDFATGHFDSTGVYRYSMRLDDTGGTATLTSTTTLRFEVATAPSIKAFIVPESISDYTQWLPQGPSYPAVGGKGNTLPVHVVLEDTAAHTGVTQKFTTKFFLRNVSKLPGWCTNYPLRRAGDGDFDKPDLRFDAPSVATEATISDDKLELDTATGKGDQTVTIASYDSGSYGSLQATITLEDGSAIDAELKPELARLSGPSNALTIPADKNGNHVADWFEDHNGATDRPASWDEDALPVGQADFGDGLTLFEEYRGVVALGDQGPAHLRLDPRKKDAFMYDPDGLFAQYYLPTNPARVSWHVLKPDLFVYHGGFSYAQDPDDRWLNSNTPDQPDLRYARQYVMVTRSGCVHVRPTTANPNGPFYNPRDPRDRDAAGRSLNTQEAGYDRGDSTLIRDPTDGQPCHSTWAAEACVRNMAFMVRDLGTDAHASAADITRAQFAQNANLVIHEVGHLLSIPHHRPKEGGNQQCAMACYDQTVWRPGLMDVYPKYCGDVGGPVGADNCFTKITVKCKPSR